MLKGPAALLLATAAWKSGVADAGATDGWSAGEEFSANTYVEVTQGGVQSSWNPVDCNHQPGDGFVFLDLWLINGNPPAGQSLNWVEAGTSYCDDFKEAAHVSYSKAVGGVQGVVNHATLPVLNGIKYKHVRASENDNTYTSYAIPVGGPITQLQTQNPQGVQGIGSDESDGWGGNFSMAGLETRNNPNTTVKKQWSMALKYKTGPNAAVQNWAGQDDCRYEDDAPRGVWKANGTQWESSKPNNNNVPQC